jgi:hypothetical protein
MLSDQIIFTLSRKIGAVSRQGARNGFRDVVIAESKLVPMWILIRGFRNETSDGGAPEVGLLDVHGCDGLDVFPSR